MEEANFVAHREWRLINLEFSLFFSERMWLHYSLLCCCHSSSVVASPLLVSILKTASALSCQKTTKIILTSFLCSYVNIFRITAVLWYCVKTPLLPSPSSVLLPIASQYISPSAKANETKRGLLCAWCQIHFQCGWGSQWDYVMIAQKQSKPGHGTAHWSGAAPSIIIIITLKDLHWQREESQEDLWAIAVQIAPSVDQKNKE